MNEENIRKWIKENDYTAYELTKHIDLSLQSIQNFIDQTNKPRRSTLKKISDFINEQNNEFHNNLSLLKETPPEYQNISNKEIFNLLEYIGGALIKNNEAVTELLIKTHDNTKELLQITKSINIENLNTLTKKAKSS